MNSDLAAVEVGIAEEPAAKRTKLKPYDLLPAQLLNTMGASGVETIALAKLANVQKKGNKAAPYFSELCDADENRQGIAVSRVAEVQLKCGAKLSLDVYRKNIKDDLYKAAMSEFNQLKPSFEMLLGKDVAGPDTGDTVSSIIYANAGEYKEKAAVDAATEVVYNWLKKPVSKWRSLVSLMGGGGLFYCASVHEKSHRAYIAHGEAAPVPLAAYQKMCRLRLCGEGAAAAQSDLNGL